MDTVFTGIILFLGLAGLGFVIMANEIGRYWNEKDK